MARNSLPAARYTGLVSTRDALHALIDALPDELLWIAEIHLTELHAGGGTPDSHAMASAFEAAGPIRAEDVEGPDGGWRAAWARHGITDADLDAILE